MVAPREQARKVMFIPWMGDEHNIQVLRVLPALSLLKPLVRPGQEARGSAFVHPWHAHRTPCPLGAQGLSTHRWIVGGKLAVVLNNWGLVCGWDAAAATVHDSTFHGLLRRFEGRMMCSRIRGLWPQGAIRRP